MEKTRRNEAKEKTINRQPIYETSNRYNEEDFTMDELNNTIKKLKRRKATGPDDMPIEALKELGEEGRSIMLEIINKWWRGEDTMPIEVCRARIALIFKKEIRRIQKTIDQYHD